VFSYINKTYLQSFLIDLKNKELKTLILHIIFLKYKSYFNIIFINILKEEKINLFTLHLEKIIFKICQVIK